MSYIPFKLCPNLNVQNLECAGWIRFPKHWKSRPDASEYIGEREVRPATTRDSVVFWIQSCFEFR